MENCDCYSLGHPAVAECCLSRRTNYATESDNNNDDDDDGDECKGIDAACRIVGPRQVAALVEIYNGPILKKL